MASVCEYRRSSAGCKCCETNRMCYPHPSNLDCQHIRSSLHTSECSVSSVAVNFKAPEWWGMAMSSHITVLDVRAGVGTVSGWLGPNAVVLWGVYPMSSGGLGKWGRVCWSHPYCVQGSGTEGWGLKETGTEQSGVLGRISQIQSNEMILQKEGIL